jgi:hypothetical protein
LLSLGETRPREKGQCKIQSCFRNSLKDGPIFQNHDFSRAVGRTHSLIGVLQRRFRINAKMSHNRRNIERG